MIVDLFMVHQFLKRLIAPFDKWEAYKLGIIDAHGNIIKAPKDRTKQDKDAFGKFDLMILKLKRTIEKLPGNKRLLSKAALFYLLRENLDGEVDQTLLEAYIKEAEGIPSTNTTSIPATETKPKRVLKRRNPLE